METKEKHWCVGTIGWAVLALKEGRRVRREGWNRKGMWLEIDRADGWKYQEPHHLRNGLPKENFVWMKTAGDTMVPWLCSQSDLLAHDWEIADAVTS